jgi:hypothetical protein
MLGIIAAVLIVLWLLGFFGFHVSTGVIHVLLVIGIVMLLAHFSGVDKQHPERLIHAKKGML